MYYWININRPLNWNLSLLQLINIYSKSVIGENFLFLIVNGLFNINLYLVFIYTNFSTNFDAFSYDYYNTIGKYYFANLFTDEIRYN